MGISRRCSRCGRAIAPGITGKREDADAVEIREVRIGVGGEVEAQGADRQRASGEVTRKVGAQGDRVGLGEVTRKVGAQGDRVGLVDPHVSLTSSDESHKLLCCQCLYVLRPILFPPHPQPERLTLGLEDLSLIRELPRILIVLGAVGGHVEIERDGEGLMVHLFTTLGTVESYTVGRSGDLVRIPGRRPDGTSMGRRVRDGDSSEG
jgi:hypothetical protein